jgi:RNA polymerase sigma-70 factor (ECF subfamily)
MSYVDPMALRAERDAATEQHGRDALLSWESLYRRHSDRVARWSVRLGVPRDEVEDAVQEVFLIVQRRLGSFRGDAKVATWLFGITENVVRHRRRKERWRGWLGRAPEDALRDLPSVERGPMETLEARDAQQLVYQALDGVSERYRSAFLLFELEGMAGEAIAELLDVKVGTLWVWLHRARAQFVKALEKLGARRTRP